MIRYRIKQLTKAHGPWASEVFAAETEHQIAQAVVAGFIVGEPRWAESMMDGSLIYALDARGQKVDYKPRGFVPFDSWQALRAHVALREPVYYHAPLDATPRAVAITRMYKNGKLRVDPQSNDADPFTADEGHLDRFRRVF